MDAARAAVNVAKTCRCLRAAPEAVAALLVALHGSAASVPVAQLEPLFEGLTGRGAHPCESEQLALFLDVQVRL